jgi:phage-related protein
MDDIIFEFYDEQEFDAFLLSLPLKERVRLVTLIAKIQQRGLIDATQMHWVSKLDDNLFEIRSKFANNIQRALYFHVEGTHFVITHGFTKKSQKTPLKELNKAKNRRSEWEKHNGNI